MDGPSKDSANPTPRAAYEEARLATLGAIADFAPAVGPEVAAMAEMIAFLDDPTCFDCLNTQRHFTASAFVVDPERRRAFLVRHRELDLWLQPSGHCDETLDLTKTALREARKETGLTSVRLASPGIFDLAVHLIPAHGDVLAHLHYDVAFLAEADPQAPLAMTSGSMDVAWVTKDDPRASEDARVLRMVSKALA